MLGFLDMYDHHTMSFKWSIEKKNPQKSNATSCHYLATTQLYLPPSNSFPFIELNVDDTQPTTSVQIRLADGTRMVSKFNHMHTVGDIRNFILTSRPGPHREFRLQEMGFPPRILEDMSATLEASGLLNAVVMQKFES